MQITTPAGWVEKTEYFLRFRLAGHRRRGFKFPCDAFGRVNVRALSPEQRVLYKDCVSGAVAGHRVHRGVLETYAYTRRQAAVGICVCGADVVLDGAAACDGCGREYDAYGEELEAEPEAAWRPTGNMSDVDFGYRADRGGW